MIFYELLLLVRGPSGPSDPPHRNRTWPWSEHVDGAVEEVVVEEVVKEEEVVEEEVVKEEMVDEEVVEEGREG